MGIEETPNCAMFMVVILRGRVDLCFSALYISKLRGFLGFIVLF